MPIPEFDQHGLLPVGVHDCTLEELEARLGCFQTTDRRPVLFAKLKAFVSEARASGIVRWLVVDGSFVTASALPNDIDLVLVVAAEHDFAADLNPTAYNVVSKRRVHRQYGFDLLVARDGSVEHRRWVEFFQQERLAPHLRKGILRLRP